MTNSLKPCDRVICKLPYFYFGMPARMVSMYQDPHERFKTCIILLEIVGIPIHAPECYLEKIPEDYVPDIDFSPGDRVYSVRPGRDLRKTGTVLWESQIPHPPQIQLYDYQLDDDGDIRTIAACYLRRANDIIEDGKRDLAAEDEP